MHELIHLITPDIPGWQLLSL